MSAKKDKVPCPCRLCKGSLVTYFVRHKHMEKYFSPESVKVKEQLDGSTVRYGSQEGDQFSLSFTSNTHVDNSTDTTWQCSRSIRVDSDNQQGIKEDKNLQIQQNCTFSTLLSNQSTVAVVHICTHGSYIRS